MPDYQHTTADDELFKAVLSYLSVFRVASFLEISRHLATALPLTDEDRAKSPYGNAEEIWEDRLRNITSIKDQDGNYLYKGRFAEPHGGLALIDKGLH